MSLLERIQHLQFYICNLEPNEKDYLNKLISSDFENKGKLSLVEIMNHILFVLNMYDYDTETCQDLMPEAPFDYDYFFTSFNDFKEAIDNCKDPEAEIIIHDLVWIRVINIKEVLLAGV